MKLSVRVLSATLILSLAACSQTGAHHKPSPSDAPGQKLSLSDLTGREWLVENIMEGGVIDFSHTTLIFSADGSVSGSTGCNSYGGSVKAEADGLTIGPLRTTRMACAPALMDQEQKFLKVLSQPVMPNIDETGELTLTSAEGSISAR